MQYRQIKASKFKPKQPAKRKREKVLTYLPRPLKAAGQHIDTEQLAESIGTTPMSPSGNLRRLDRAEESPAWQWMRRELT
jgi:hypothetical protein